MELEAGTEIGGYRIEVKAGTGAFGDVYRARRVGSSEHVALKITVSATEKDEAFITGAVARLRHPYIVQTLEVFRHDGRLVLIQEWADGGTLEDRLDTEAFPADEVTRLGTELASGLARAHERGVVHRDIKPSNVLIFRTSLPPRDDRYKLSDFGIGALVERGTGLTRAGQVAGTPLYMSPEQARGERLSAASDIFSLGLVLFRALYGQVPDEVDDGGATTLYSVLRSRITDTIRVPPSPLQHVIQRCLVLDPHERPTAEELDHLLFRLASHPLPWPDAAQAQPTDDRATTDQADPQQHLPEAWPSRAAQVPTRELESADSGRGADQEHERDTTFETEPDSQQVSKSDRDEDPLAERPGPLQLEPPSPGSTDAARQTARRGDETRGRLGPGEPAAGSGAASRPAPPATSPPELVPPGAPTPRPVGPSAGPAGGVPARGMPPLLARFRRDRWWRRFCARLTEAMVAGEALVLLVAGGVIGVAWVGSVAGWGWPIRLSLIAISSVVGVRLLKWRADERELRTRAFRRMSGRLEQGGGTQFFGPRPASAWWQQRFTERFPRVVATCLAVTGVVVVALLAAVIVWASLRDTNPTEGIDAATADGAGESWDWLPRATVGSVLVAVGLGLALLIYSRLSKQTPQIQRQAADVLFQAESRVELTQSLMLEVDEVVRRLRAVDSRLLGMTLKAMVSEYDQAKESNDRIAALTNVVDIMDKLRVHLSPWYVRHKEVIATSVAIVGCLSGVASLLTGFLG